MMKKAVGKRGQSADQICTAVVPSGSSSPGQVYQALLEKEMGPKNIQNTKKVKVPWLRGQKPLKGLTHLSIRFELR